MCIPIDNSSSSSMGKQQSNAKVSICTNDIQSFCYGCLHTYQNILMNSHERGEQGKFFPILNKLIYSLLMIRDQELKY